MIRVFICPKCGKVRVVSKYLKASCYECGRPMVVCHTPYVEWVELDETEREQIRARYWKSEK
ncbi:DNA-directed RNA polymerase subunit M [Cuneatibacter sp. NSJ-177]|uniref:DNA-directed RNA polymerase subunit M n=1 Tax=Cuneatibacter sp. NSJ-177 TaxID=2931401 RepID=UPI001FD1BB1F|nr:DNA-directed RNA polymerase subunit M [Cuneatibacter sp. NSJ-177]MCJ7837246.1 DNA-directed RNA polymerase subunit M [Cuneatibacter sp. NSJ-177]